MRPTPSPASPCVPLTLPEMTLKTYPIRSGRRLRRPIKQTKCSERNGQKKSKRPALTAGFHLFLFFSPREPAARCYRRANSAVDFAERRANTKGWFRGCRNGRNGPRSTRTPRDLRVPTRQQSNTTSSSGASINQVHPLKLLRQI